MLARWPALTCLCCCYGWLWRREIWDLITLNGVAADPRTVKLVIENPQAVAGGPGGRFGPSCGCCALRTFGV